MSNKSNELKKNVSNPYEKKNVADPVNQLEEKKNYVEPAKKNEEK